MQNTFILSWIVECFSRMFYRIGKVILYCCKKLFIVVGCEKFIYFGY